MPQAPGVADWLKACQSQAGHGFPITAVQRESDFNNQHAAHSEVHRSIRPLRPAHRRRARCHQGDVVRGLRPGLHRRGWAPRNTKQWVASSYFPRLPDHRRAAGPGGRHRARAARARAALVGEAETAASRVRGRIEAILDWAKVTTAAVRTPRAGMATWPTCCRPRPRSPRSEHHAAFPYIELPAFMAALRQNSRIRRPRPGVRDFDRGEVGRSAPCRLGRDQPPGAPVDRSRRAHEGQA